MSKDQEQLIDRLVGEMGGATRRAMPPLTIAWLWFSAAVLLCAGVMHVLQPFRAGWLEQVLTVPLYSLEVTAGLLALALLSVAVFKSAVPGERSAAMYWALGSIALWLATILSGLVHPVLEPSMAGKREECYYEALYYSTATALPICLLLRRRYSVQPWLTASLAALWIAMVPAYLMQLSCMYEIEHALSHHLLPMLLTAVIWLPVFRFLLRR